jgi:ABC-type transport system involved in multi-copper enzyme maturation permease subunit
MFLFLIFATFVVALIVSFAVMWLFTKPIDGVLRRIIADEISAAWSKYMKFAILVVGVSSGVQLHELERYISPTPGGPSLSFNRWIFELYSAGIETLQGIAWMLLVFFVFALIAYVIVRIGEARREQDPPKE